ncbi:MAG TPA: PrsW family glutamic-type intramembrane protease [Gemmatimonadales bacterium]|nr:PrsW family glutamic-type intramembrane protease [Gemmatimonadales bacterium]
MTSVLAVAVSVLPVFAFLGTLLLVDSYKLVALRATLLSVAAGVVAGLAAYGANVWLRPALGLDWDQYSRYVAPVVEESLKAAFVVYLLRQNKVGFVVDAAIHGFAIGTGFAFLENLYYVHATPDATLWTWVVRGFGTAIMHGGATSIVAMVAKALQNRAAVFRLSQVLPGLGVAVVLHSLYNQFVLNPILATALIVLVLPTLSLAVFERSERDTKAWLGTGFDTDQELLRAVHTGRVSGTPVGRYIATVKSRFPAEVIVDMMCFLRLRAELAIRAKGVLMMREAGFHAAPDPLVKDKFQELAYLEKSIGKTGLRALHPFVHTSTRDLWQLTVLDGERG